MRPILLLLFIVPVIHGYCYTSSGRVDKTVTGRQIPVCEYQGLDILDGSHFKTANCMDCKCENNGQLSCCGFGINSGIYMPPVGCKIIADGCDPIFVLETDETRDCTTGKKINTRDKPTAIKPVFPGMLPMTNGMKMKSVSSTRQNGMTMSNPSRMFGNGMTMSDPSRMFLNGMMMPDPSRMLQNGRNYGYNVVYRNSYGNGLGDTTGNSLQDFMYHNGLMG